MVQAAEGEGVVEEVEVAEVAEVEVAGGVGIRYVPARAAGVPSLSPTLRASPRSIGGRRGGGCGTPEWGQWSAGPRSVPVVTAAVSSPIHEWGEETMPWVRRTGPIQGQ